MNNIFILTLLNLLEKTDWYYSERATQQFYLFDKSIPFEKDSWFTSKSFLQHLGRPLLHNQDCWVSTILSSFHQLTSMPIEFHFVGIASFIKGRAMRICATTWPCFFLMATTQGHVIWVMINAHMLFSKFFFFYLEFHLAERLGMSCHMIC